MKLTWFGGTTLRVHAGGIILVADAAGISGVDPDELVSGADLVFRLDEARTAVDAATWQPGRATMLDGEPVQVRAVDGGVLVAAPGEAPLLLLTTAMPKAGRWAREAVVVAFGEEAAELARQALEAAPRLIALAGPEAAVDEAFAGLRERLDGTALVALEKGLALEV